MYTKLFLLIRLYPWLTIGWYTYSIVSSTYWWLKPLPPQEEWVHITLEKEHKG